MIELLSAVPAQLLLAVVAVELMAESGLLVGVFLPGSPLVLALGFLAGQGVVEVWAAIPTVAAASALGGQHGFLRGRRRGGPLEQRVTARLGERRARRLDAALEGRAEVAVAVAQCFGVVRTLVPRLAARSGLSHARFTACNVPMAVVWASALVLLGAWSGAAYERVESVVGLMGLPLVAAAAAIVLVVQLIRRRRAARAASDSPGVTPAGANGRPGSSRFR
ncbi:membrane-associated protein [Saccharopolyspora erythraea NRRL 2338]|uniref:VTT domain-containing protein n=1 Tax=Saccharopolyspora erythraea TaxID=1836 RepID=A0ABN1CQV7_SACER|nr:VTT domain-containing protein [Saccharopolyspora erythraea]EQD82300.1 membrane protein [Saccharopolyspora erythraea D]PFG99567.1 membrane-associated protein [Saccharopolyspora erythraea NRRL 2338]QRK89465.1 VTT domain-containing protein [Saccharopolyspora erythraea]